MNTHHSNPVEQTTSVQLPRDPAVTIFFDGLIYTAYDERCRLYQAAVHTGAEEHHLVIEVRERGNPELLFPTAALPWDTGYVGISENCPFWLYVDSGNGLHPKEFSAQLYLPNGPDDRSFDRILNFEGLYGHKITLNPERFAEFNFPHGICYSYANTDATLIQLDQNDTPISEEPINVSTKGAIDIDLVSDDEVTREIVLINKYGERFFNFPLQQGKYYDINVLNQPVPGHSGHNNPGQHFLQFYELFERRPNEQKFLVDATSVSETSAAPGEPGSPPCISTSGNREAGLP